MEANYFESDTIPTWHTDKFAGYVLTEVASYDELLEFRARCLTDHPGMKPLLVIDDPGQAFYTSGHALEDLESGTASFDAAQYAAHLLAEVQTELAEVDLDSLAGRLLPVDALEVRLAEMNRDPFRMVGDRCFCLLVPVADQRHAFVGAVQSYFGPSPAQVYAMINQFSDRFDLELVGLGATYIYLTRSSALTGSTAQEVVDAIGRFHADFDDAAHDDLRAAIDGNTDLILTFRDW